MVETNIWGFSPNKPPSRAGTNWQSGPTMPSSQNCSNEIFPWVAAWYSRGHQSWQRRVGCHINKIEKNLPARDPKQCWGDFLSPVAVWKESARTFRRAPNAFLTPTQEGSLHQDYLCKISVSGSLHQDPCSTFGSRSCKDHLRFLSQDLFNWNTCAKSLCQDPFKSNCIRILKHHSCNISVWGSSGTTCARPLSQDLGTRILREHLCKISVSGSLHQDHCNALQKHNFTSSAQLFNTHEPLRRLHMRSYKKAILLVFRVIRMHDPSTRVHKKLQKLSCTSMPRDQHAHPRTIFAEGSSLETERHHLWASDTHGLCRGFICWSMFQHYPAHATKSWPEVVQYAAVATQIILKFRFLKRNPSQETSLRPQHPWCE